MITNYPYVSVVVPVYNAEGMVSELIKSLINLNYPKDRYEIIMVDNGSKDRTQEIICSYPVNLLIEDGIRGAAAARNKGIFQAKGELVAFTDSDCVVDKEWLKNLSLGFDEPQYGGFAGKIRPFKMKSIFEQYAQRNGLYSQEDGLHHWFLPCVATANVTYRRQILIALGGFDTCFSTGGEDTELAWRMQIKFEKKIKFNPEAIVYHKNRQDFRSLLKQSIRNGRGYVILCNKFPQIRKNTLVETGRFLKRVSYFYLRFMVRLFKFPFIKNKSGIYLVEHLISIACSVGKYFSILKYRIRQNKGNLNV